VQYRYNVATMSCAGAQLEVFTPHAAHILFANQENNFAIAYDGRGGMSTGLFAHFCLRRCDNNAMRRVVTRRPTGRRPRHLYPDVFQVHCARSQAKRGRGTAPFEDSGSGSRESRRRWSLAPVATCACGGSPGRRAGVVAWARPQHLPAATRASCRGPVRVRIPGVAAWPARDGVNFWIHLPSGFDAGEVIERVRRSPARLPPGPLGVLVARVKCSIFRPATATSSGSV
jgi:hypothetical protein